MKVRRVYYRTKGEKIIAIEGKIGKKSIHLHTLGNAENHLLKLLSLADYFPSSKKKKIEELFMRLDFKSNRGNKSKSKVRRRNIVRTKSSSLKSTPNRKGGRKNGKA